MRKGSEKLYLWTWASASQHVTMFLNPCLLVTRSAHQPSNLLTQHNLLMRAFLNLIGKQNGEMWDP
jgi:hypothetical protein